MDILDLFKDWTPEMIDAVKYQGSGCRTRESSGAYWDSKTKEEIQKHCKKSFHSEESKKKGWWTHWGSLTPEQRVRKMEKSLNSPEANLRKRVSRSEGTRRVMSKCCKNYLANLTPGQMETRMKNSFLSDKAVLKSSQSNHTKPSMPEWFAGFWIEKNHPREWAYTGDRKSMDLLRSRGYTGLKIPDFFNINGERAVIEVLGGIGYWHTEEEEGEKIAYYKKRGFVCLVLFEEDCYDYDRLEVKYRRLFKNGGKKKL